MTHIVLKRVYEDYSEADGFRILVDKLWPRGVKKETLKLDLWDKDIAPSTELRKWYHEDISHRWNDFMKYYLKELSLSDAISILINKIKEYDTVTLLYAAKDPEHNHAVILKSYLEKFCN